MVDKQSSNEAKILLVELVQLYDNLTDFINGSFFLLDAVDSLVSPHYGPDPESIEGMRISMEMTKSRARELKAHLNRICKTAKASSGIEVV